MIFKSKMIPDPNKRFPNKMGLTIGLTFYTPKYWNCREHDFDAGWLWLPPDSLSDEMMDMRIDAQLRHAKCKWPYRHRSEKGYMYWTGPKRRYDFRYMGSTHPRYVWWKPLSIREHHTYVRLRNNGPQNPPQKPIDQDILDAIGQMHKEEWIGVQAKMDARRKERGL